MKNINMNDQGVKEKNARRKGKSWLRWIDILKDQKYAGISNWR